MLSSQNLPGDAAQDTLPHRPNPRLQRVPPFSNSPPRFPRMSTLGVVASAARRLSPQALRDSWKLFPVSAKLSVPAEIVPPSYVHSKGGSPSIRNHTIEYKTKEQVAQMRRACELASHIREFAGKQVAPGITTDEIDKLVHAEVLRLGVYPSPLGYCGFPKSICTSVNNVVCHGIPDARPLVEGDIINIDVSVFADEYHGDCSGQCTACTHSPPAVRACGVGIGWNEGVFRRARLRACIPAVARPVRSTRSFRISPPPPSLPRPLPTPLTPFRFVSRPRCLFPRLPPRRHVCGWEDGPDERAPDQDHAGSPHGGHQAVRAGRAAQGDWYD